MITIQPEQRDGETVVEEKEKSHPLEGITEWRNKSNGFFITDLESKADPDKRSPEWIMQSQAGMTRADWNREFGSSWNVFDGKAVYGSYDEDVHLVKGSIIAPRRTKLVSGWDAGPNDINLAWVLALVSPEIPAALFIDEYQVDDGDTDTFVEVCNSRLRMEWAKLGGFSVHVCDQSVFTKSGVAQGKAVADLMKKRGMFPIPGEISFTKRREIVDKMLVTAVKWERNNMVPRWRVHERCVLLRKAMAGGYHLPKNVGNIGGFRPVPLKNESSHIANAMEYACSKINSMDYEIPFEGRRLPVMNRI